MDGNIPAKYSTNTMTASVTRSPVLRRIPVERNSFLVGNLMLWSAQEKPLRAGGMMPLRRASVAATNARASAAFDAYDRDSLCRRSCSKVRSLIHYISKTSK